MCGELFKMMAGIDMTHVPFRGTTLALASLLGAQVQAMFASMPAAIEHIRAGKLRALGVTTASRSELLPGVSSISELLPGYDAGGYYGIVAPRNTPANIIEKLNNEIVAGLANPELKSRIDQLGIIAIPHSSADFGKFIVNETEKWAKVVKFANIKAG
jgi:tripartite-type tricarboxylate transporter receptor subunit TctC